MNVSKENGGYSTITLNNKGDTVYFLQYNEDSVLDGYVRKYYENGNIRSISKFKNGELHGPEVVYYPNGDTQYTVDYENGKKNGVWNVYWDESGKLKYQLWYWDDIKFGTALRFNKKGIPDTTGFYALDGMYGKIIHQGDSTKIFGKLVYSIYNSTELNPKDTFSERTFIASPPGWNVKIKTEIMPNLKGRVLLHEEEIINNTKILTFRHTTDSAGVFNLTHNITIKSDNRVIYLDTVDFKLNYVRN